jgi:hypothetical protein
MRVQSICITAVAALALVTALGWLDASVLQDQVLICGWSCRTAFNNEL